MPHHIVTTCTRDCPSACGLIAHVEGSRAVRILGNPYHPVTRGTLCAKANRYNAMMQNPERVLHPLRRVNGSFQRISWDEALDELADKLRAAIDTNGPESILYYLGSGERSALKFLNERFFNLLGGVTTTRGSLCSGTGPAAQDMDLGERISHDPLDLANANSVVLWGRNPKTAGFGMAHLLRDLRDRDGVLCLIDPQRTVSASMCERHIQPAPGRDAYLAMAATKIILASGREDARFLAECSEGFEAYLCVLDSWDVDACCREADVSREDAEYLAALYTDKGPTATLLGWGMPRYEHAHISIRAIDGLAAVAGMFGTPGGGVSQGFDEFGPYDQSVWGRDLCPPRRKLLLPRLGREILEADDPPITTMVVTAANPACMAPDSRRIAEAFKSLDFIAMTGHFLNDTSEYADLFLPATCFLEERDFMASYGHAFVGPVNPAAAPPGETRSEFDIFQNLATRFDFAGEYVKPLDEWLAQLAAPLLTQGHSMDELMASPVRWEIPAVPYADGVFPTPSGRYRFPTDFDPAPLPAVDDAYPLFLLSTAGEKHLCSERTETSHDELVIRVHPQTAAGLGLSEGARILVESDVGSLAAKLALDDGLRRDVAACHRGGWLKAGHGLNRLTKDTASAVGGGATYYETRVRILSAQ